MGACETLGCSKMDLPRACATSTVLDDCLRNIEANRGEEVVLEDARGSTTGQAYELLAAGDTLGCSSSTAGPMRSLLRQMVPTNFEHISAVLALYRPGPMGANAHIDYADRKNGRKPIEPIHPSSRSRCWRSSATRTA
jgi:DNA polymerase-3 subunit alpha